ncbi:zf-TFIIB domain-containing protein [Bacillus wiedmannii]
MKSEFVCPKCHGNLNMVTREDLIFFKCPNKKCDFESVVDMG